MNQCHVEAPVNPLKNERNIISKIQSCSIISYYVEQLVLRMFCITMGRYEIQWNCSKILTTPPLRNQSFKPIVRCGIIIYITFVSYCIVRFLNQQNKLIVELSLFRVFKKCFSLKHFEKTTNLQATAKMKLTFKSTVHRLKKRAFIVYSYSVGICLIVQTTEDKVFIYFSL